MARDRTRLRSASAVRYGRDGRRTLLGISPASGLNVASEKAKEERVFFDPRQQALSSSDILLHVLHFLERCVAPPQASTWLECKSATGMVFHVLLGNCEVCWFASLFSFLHPDATRSLVSVYILFRDAGSILDDTMLYSSRVPKL